MNMYLNAAKSSVECRTIYELHNAVITVSNAQGTEIIRLRGVSGRHAEIDLSSCQAGIYTITLFDGDTAYRGRVLKY